MERMKFSPEGGNGMSDICSKAQLTSNSFRKPAERLRNERGEAKEQMQFSPQAETEYADFASTIGGRKGFDGDGEAGQAGGGA